MHRGFATAVNFGIVGRQDSETCVNATPTNSGQGCSSAKPVIRGAGCGSPARPDLHGGRGEQSPRSSWPIRHSVLRTSLRQPPLRHAAPAAQRTPRTFSPIACGTERLCSVVPRMTGSRLKEPADSLVDVFRCREERSTIVAPRPRIVERRGSSDERRALD